MTVESVDHQNRFSSYRKLPITANPTTYWEHYVCVKFPKGGGQVDFQKAVREVSGQPTEFGQEQPNKVEKPTIGRVVHDGDVIPEKLLKEIQKYAAGKLLYIPTGEEKKAWGETSGYRDQLQRRNIMIRNKYVHGVRFQNLPTNTSYPWIPLRKSSIRRKSKDI
jgi:hypothetical protein